MRERCGIDRVRRVRIAGREQEPAERAGGDVPARAQAQGTAEGGLRLLVVGFESGDPQVLKNIKKGTTPELGLRFMRWCKELGITVHGTFMVGLPGETHASIEASMRFACKLDPQTIQVSLAAPDGRYSID